MDTAIPDDHIGNHTGPTDHRSEQSDPVSKNARFIHILSGMPALNELRVV